jgi:hypothetical protein
MAAEYNINEDGVFIQNCPDCRGLGYVVDLIGEVRACRREECVRKKAVEILEEGGGDKLPEGDAGLNLMRDLLKSDTARSFVMGGLAGVVAKLAGDVVADAAKNGRSNPKPAPPHCAGVKCWYHYADCRCECDGCVMAKPPLP